MTGRLVSSPPLTRQVTRSRTYICESRGVGQMPATVAFYRRVQRSVADSRPTCSDSMIDQEVFSQNLRNFRLPHRTARIPIRYKRTAAGPSCSCSCATVSWVCDHRLGMSTVSWLTHRRSKDNTDHEHSYGHLKAPPNIHVNPSNGGKQKEARTCLGCGINQEAAAGDAVEAPEDTGRTASRCPDCGRCIEEWRARRGQVHTSTGMGDQGSASRHEESQVSSVTCSTLAHH